MAIYYWWHNVTQDIWNESDLEDFVENTKSGDKIMFSISGNSLINSLQKPNVNKYELDGEYDYLRKQFYDKYIEWHEEPFFNSDY